MNDQIKLQFALSHKYLKPNAEQVIYLMLQLKQSKEVQQEQDKMVPEKQSVESFSTRRKPLNVSFVLDRSGSMAGEKLEYTKKAVSFALGHFDAGDIAALVIFDEEIEVVVPAKKAQNKDLMIKAVQRVHPGGCTNLSGGLLKGIAEVRKNLSEQYVNRVILLTDGLANEGITDAQRLVNKVKEVRSKNISVSTLGVGEDFDEDLLVKMAEAAEGNFYFIANPDQIPEIFQQELHGLLNIIAQNLELELTPAANVKILGVLGYQPTWGPTVKFHLPDMHEGDTKTVLLELAVRPEKIGMQPLVDLSLTYDNIKADLASVTYNAKVDLEVTNDPELLNKGLDIMVVKEVEIYRTAVAKDQAVRLADEGKYGEAGQMLQQRKIKLQELYKQSGDEEIYAEINSLEEDNCVMEAQNLTPLDRKRMVYSSYSARNKR